MKDNSISKVYAEALIKLGEDLEIDVASELTEFQKVINISNDLENVLFLDLFTIEEKKEVIKSISEKINMSKLLENFVLFTIEERRMGLFPLIYKEVIVIDDSNRGFIRGVIEGSEDTISAEKKSEIIKYLKSKITKNLNFQYKTNEDLIAGYRVTVDDLQLDISAENQIKQFQKLLKEE